MCSRPSLAHRSQGISSKGDIGTAMVYEYFLDPFESHLRRTTPSLVVLLFLLAQFQGEVFFLFEVYWRMLHNSDSTSKRVKGELSHFPGSPNLEYVLSRAPCHSRG